MAIVTASHQSLAEIGLTNLGAVHWNLSVPQLVEQSVARNEAVLASNGALVAATGERTGRSPKDKFIVRTPENTNRIAWGKINQPIEPAVFDRFLARVSAYLQGREVFVLDAWAGADPAHRLPIRVVAEYAWHELFARQLFHPHDTRGAGGSIARPLRSSPRRNSWQFQTPMVCAARPPSWSILSRA